MGYVILLAGASGAIGRRLLPLLSGAGHHVIGTTRSKEKFADLRALGAEPVAVDVIRRDGPVRGGSNCPTSNCHPPTDGFAQGARASRMAEAVVRNARIREERTRNLLTAAAAAGAHRVVAQSIAWAYAPGPEPHQEDDALDLGAVGSRAVSVRGIAALEHSTFNAPPLAGVVLRYRQLYGPGTGVDAAVGPIPLHVDAAAYAALLSIDKGAPGIFNIVRTE